MENSDYIKNKEKLAQDMERYETIVNYFEENPDRVKINTDYLWEDSAMVRQNKTYLTYLMNEIFNNIEVKSPIFNKYLELNKRLESILKESESKSGTNTGTGVSI
jgi:hypothetical protein